jgi:hypothetical protein
VSNVPEGYSKIFMYYGNPSAHPVSDGDATFLFFDDFMASSLDITKWNSYQPSGSEINTKDGLLILTNGSAIISAGSKGFLQPDSAPCIIETKAKAVFVNTSFYRDASMFARYSSDIPPYKYAYVFSSSSDLDKPLTLVYYDTGRWKNLTSYEKPKVDFGWNRLKYILNGTDNVICRYFYSSFSVDGYDGVSSSRYTNGYFGLCTIQSDATKAYYDWIFVRKFAIKTNLIGGGREDAEPFAYIGEVQSKNFGWSDYDPNTLYSGLDYTLSTELGKDFVYDDQNSATFYFKNLTLGQYYSIVFTIGNKTRLVHNMIIEITGGNKQGSQQSISIGPVSFASIQDDPYKKIWLSSIYPYADVDGRGKLEVKFSNTDSLYHWAICELTLEKGERIIKMAGGGL